MNNKFSTIELERQFFEAEPDFRTFKFRKRPVKEIYFKDYVIDGRSLRKTIMNKCIGWRDTTLVKDDFPIHYQIEYLRRMLGEITPDLNSGRTAIYVCPYDGDLEGCGAIGCYVEFTDETVRWHDFIFDSNDDEEDDSEIADDDTTVEGINEFLFVRKDYDKLLRDEIKRLKKLGS